MRWTKNFPTEFRTREVVSDTIILDVNRKKET